MIKHIPHVTDLLFQMPTQEIARLINAYSNEGAQVYRKIDDQMSFMCIVHKDGKVGLKYKGSGSYFYSRSAIIRSDQPTYRKKILKALIDPLTITLPVMKEDMEFQGGYVGKYDGCRIKANVIEYVPLDHKMYAINDQVITLHTKFVKGKAFPIRNFASFTPPTGLRLMSHFVDVRISTDLKKFTAKSVAQLTDPDEKVFGCIDKKLRMFLNTDLIKTAEGFAIWLTARENKRIYALKTSAGQKKAKDKLNALCTHIRANEDSIHRFIKMEYSLQKTVDHLVEQTYYHDKTRAFKAVIDGAEVYDEGYIFEGTKFVIKSVFTKAVKSNPKFIRP